MRTVNSRFQLYHSHSLKNETVEKESFKKKLKKERKTRVSIFLMIAEYLALIDKFSHWTTDRLSFSFSGLLHQLMWCRRRMLKATSFNQSQRKILTGFLISPSQYLIRRRRKGSFLEKWRKSLLWFSVQSWLPWCERSENVIISSWRQFWFPW